MINRIIQFNGSSYRVLKTAIDTGGNQMLFIEPYNAKIKNPDDLLKELKLQNINLYEAIFNWWIEAKFERQYFDRRIYAPNKDQNVKAIRDMFELDKRLPLDVIRVLSETITNEKWLNKIFMLKSLRKRFGGLQLFDIILNNIKAEANKTLKNNIASNSINKEAYNML